MRAARRAIPLPLTAPAPVPCRVPAGVLALALVALAGCAGSQGGGEGGGEGAIRRVSPAAPVDLAEAAQADAAYATRSQAAAADLTRRQQALDGPAAERLAAERAEIEAALARHGPGPVGLAVEPDGGYRVVLAQVADCPGPGCPAGPLVLALDEGALRSGGRAAAAAGGGGGRSGVDAFAALPETRSRLCGALDRLARRGVREVAVVAASAAPLGLPDDALLRIGAEAADAIARGLDGRCATPIPAIASWGVLPAPGSDSAGGPVEAPGEVAVTLRVALWETLETGDTETGDAG